MKSLQVCYVCLGTALAGDVISGQWPDLGWSSSRYMPSPEGLVCPSQNLTDSVYQAPLLKEKHDPSSPWTHASPCTRNGTQEFCVFSSSTFAEDRGISLVTTPEMAAFLASIPAFTRPGVHRGVNQDIVQSERHRYKAVKIPGKDIGLVATEPLYPGDHIMSNTPSVMIDYDSFELAAHQMQRLQATGVDYLPLAHRTKFLELSTHSGAENYVEKVEKIMQTNAFDLEMPDERQSDFYIVFPEIARMNHDCRPNAAYYWDPQTLTHHVHTIRPIAVGEEITVSYIDPLQSRAKRLKQLHSTWGFRCSCSHCRQNAAMAAASDARVAQIQTLRAELEDYAPTSRATPQMAELLVSLYEQERLDQAVHEALALAAVEFNGAGEPWTAARYARLAVQRGLPAVGPKDGDVVEMGRLAEAPWEHWSWMLRSKKRMQGEGKKKKA